MDEDKYIDPCEGCEFRYCVNSVFISTCLWCKRIYNEGTSAYERHKDLYKKKED